MLQTTLPGEGLPQSRASAVSAQGGGAREQKESKRKGNLRNCNFKFQNLVSLVKYIRNQKMRRGWARAGAGAEARAPLATPRNHTTEQVTR